MINGLPQKLQMLRAQYGFSQKQLADKMNLSTSIISAYETGERTPSTEILLSLSYIYNCSVDFLLGKQSSTSAITLDVSGLTEKQLNALLVLIQAMKESN